jgi:3-hydroxybutyryl-CoA dehydrogenase
MMTTPQSTENSPTTATSPKGLVDVEIDVAVIGSGAMGRGIGQLFAQIGCNVVMIDTQEAALSAAKEHYTATFAKLLEKGRLTEAKREELLSRFSFSTELTAAHDAGLVIEAIVENLGVKRELFTKLEGIVSAQAIIASNTSSLSITNLASICTHPERIAGLHFFNPVPLMKVVEIVEAPLTSKATVEALRSLIQKTGHQAVICQDTPGFIVNHAGRGYGVEALRALGEGVASFAEIDAIMREQINFAGNSFKLGPFELLDLTGLDVSHPVMESIYHQYFEEPRFRPSVITKQRMDAKLLGRKTKRGFYDYSSGGQQLLPKDVVPAPDTATIAAHQRYWVAQCVDATKANLVQTLVEALGGLIDSAKIAAPDSIIITMPWGTDASQECTDFNLDASRTIALDTLFPFDYKACKRRVLMATPATRKEVLAQATALFGSDGAKVSVLSDSPGFISQRICAMIINIGCEIAQQQVASPKDIDSAVQLGLGYPQGPLSMGNTLGAPEVFALLKNLHAVTGDDRFRPSAWLRRRAQLKLSLLQQ